MLETNLETTRRCERLAEAAIPATSTEEAHLNTVLAFLSKLFPEKLKEAATKLEVRATPSAAAAAAASAGPVRRARSPDFQRHVSPSRIVTGVSPPGR